MTDNSKKTRLSKFNFEDAGAAVALVGSFQGGPANGHTTLITKSTSDISEEELNKAIEEPQKDSQPSVESQGEDVVKTEGKENTTKSKEDIIQMSEENKVTQEQLEEQINKAAESIVAKRLEELEKSYEDKVNAATKEVELLKAREEAREKQGYLSKAEGYAKYLGEEADKEAIAKALSAVEKSEDAKAILDVLKALKDTVEKDDEKLFEEVGKSTTQDQPSDMESKVEAIQKSLMKEKGLTEHAAYVEAFDQVRAEQA